MFENGVSPADLAAVVGNNEGFSGGAWWIIIFILFFAFGGGGWNNGTQYATSADVQRGFDTQNVSMKLDTMSQTQAANAYDNAQLINQASMNNMQSIYNQTNAMNSGFNGVNATLNSGFDNVNMNINNLAHQMEQCCCSLKTQMLQDKYDAAQNQLNLAEIAAANATQTQNLLNTMGRWAANPPYPYYGYGTTIS